MEESDLTAWTGKPPERFSLKPQSDNDDAGASSGSNQKPSAPASDSSSADEINYDGAPADPAPTLIMREAEGSEDDREVEAEDEDSLVEVIPQFQHKFFIDVPRLDEEKKQEYKYLPGHFSVQKIMSEFKGDRYMVKLMSGERHVVTSNELRKLENGRLLLTNFLRHNMNSVGKRRRAQPPSPPAGIVNWNTVDISSSEEDKPTVLRGRGRASKKKGSDVDQESTDGGADSGGDEEVSDHSEPSGRRSSRLTGKRHANYFQNELIDLEDDENRPKRGRPKRGTQQPEAKRIRSLARVTSARTTTRRTATHAAESSSEPEVSAARRSERTRTQPRRSMRERQEDEISAHSEEEIGPKVVGAKEVFLRIPENDPFRKRHAQDCESCAFQGDSAEKGPLIFCQGCTVSYHKVCLRGRSVRDHLVTKVGESLFVLQCSRCIGVAHENKTMHPHYGTCTGCNELGPLSQPLRTKLTTKQEQLQREENGGKDPITIVEPSFVNNTANVMFRCCQCKRVWHMHHLPDRKTATSGQDDYEDEILDSEELAQKRFELYHRSWTCKDCIENQIQIDTIVAWRPVNIDNYQPGVSPEAISEANKEYLIKWRNQSYLRTKWMPGDWVFGLATYQRIFTFNKKPENRLPKLTTKDAIPEEYLRIDIVFDVKYTSVVRNSTKEIDMARVKEVDLAFVKYKGLGFEDAIWEHPPKYDDTERFNDYKTAYQDYVLKLHVSVPPQSTLRRHLQAVRNQDFETKLMRKTQPAPLVGGQIMQYQMEGLNWLYYQWFINQNAILADEMGLGKTIQLIAFFALMVHEHKCWPFLVVVPNSTCPNWRREIKNWAPSLRVVTYYGSSAARKLIHDFELFPKVKDEGQNSSKKKAEVKDIKAHIVITSYESIVEEKTRQSLMRVPWQGLVVDEGQRLKNEKNQLYECLLKHFRFPFKVLLTGTPLQNNVRELFNLLQFLDRSMNAADMEAKYANLTDDNVPELHSQLKKFFLRRTKAQVLTFLPPVAQIIVPVTMSPLQKKIYKSILARNPQLMKAIFNRDGPSAGKERVNLNNILMSLRRTLCHPFVYSTSIEERSYEAAKAHQILVEASSKLQLLSIMLPKLHARGHRVLMFSQFLDNLTIMEDFLDGLGFQHRRLDGGTSSMEKQKRIDEFNAKDSPLFAFLLSTRAGGVGINLASADTVIILDPDFNPHQDIQALSRAHRIGQKNKVLVFQLMTKGSAEEKMMQVGKKKMALDHVLIERMDQEDEAGMDLQSILRHGAEALFAEDDKKDEDIVYDSASVDRLLERTQVEDTKTSEDKSAESQFSFARIWANNKNAFEDRLSDEATGANTPNDDFWKKILDERERAQAEEDRRNAEALGRGKRKRQNVDYGGDGLDGELNLTPIKRIARVADEEGSDTDFQDRPIESDVETGEETDGSQGPKRNTIKAQPFKRANVMRGDAPHFNGEYAYEPRGVIPPTHLCSACEELHPMGWCRIKLAGVEHCGLCGLAHLGHGRTCPHLNSEAQVATLLAMLKESPEEQSLKDAAAKYLRSIRGDLTRRRIQKQEAAERAKREAAIAARGDVNVNGYHGGVNGIGSSGYPAK